MNNGRPSASALQESDGLLFMNSAKHYVHMVLPRQNTANPSTQECKDFTGVGAVFMNLPKPLLLVLKSPRRFLNQ